LKGTEGKIDRDREGDRETGTDGIGRDRGEDRQGHALTVVCLVVRFCLCGRDEINMEIIDRFGGGGNGGGGGGG
jgi:hypothetical protein